MNVWLKNIGLSARKEPPVNRSGDNAFALINGAEFAGHSIPAYRNLTGGRPVMGVPTGTGTKAFVHRLVKPNEVMLKSLRCVAVASPRATRQRS